MDKLLLIADTHLGIKNSSDDWHKIVIDIFKEARDYCIKNGILWVVHFGDFFDNRKSLDGRTYAAALEIASIMKGITVSIITGNHDTYYKNKLKPSFLDIFRDEDDIIVVDETKQYGKDIVLVPWGGQISEEFTGKYLFGHFELNGYNMNSGYVCNKGEEPSKYLNRFEKVLSGHFHTPSDDGRVTYLGAPYQQTFHDKNGKRGFYTFELATGDLEFIECNIGPKFVELHTEALDLSDVKGNIIKVIFDKNYGTNENNKLMEEVSLKDPFQMNVDFSNVADVGTEEVMEDSVSELVDHKDIMVEYMKKSEPPKNINLKTAVTMVNKLMEDVKA